MISPGLGLGFGIHAEVTKEMFNMMPKRDQNTLLQRIYDKGYTAKETGGFFGIPAPTVYSRIDAHRGRQSNPEPAT